MNEFEEEEREAGTPEISNLEPRVLNLSDHRYALSLWFLPAAILLVVLIVREMARIEHTLSAEGERASRVLVYDLPVGQMLRVPIEPGTEVIRIVAHARGDESMTLLSHGARVSLHAHGNLADKKETLDLVMPGSRSRARAEEPQIVVADPLGFDVDVHGIGRGELEVKLDSVDGAQGLLVRAYRRELLDKLDVVRRERVLDEKKEEHLAARSWELDWVDLDETERSELLEGRWRKIGLLRGSKDLAVHALAISAPPVHNVKKGATALVTSLSLVAGERSSLFTTGPATLLVESDNQATIYIKREDGSAERVSAQGNLEIHALARTGVEIETEGAVTIRSDAPANIEEPVFMRAWRATTARPVVIDSEGEARVIRLSARRSVPRGWSGQVTIDMNAIFTNGTGVTRSAMGLRTSVNPSVFDRFTGDIASEAEAPTDKVVTHALVPPGVRVSFVPVSDAVDVALGELDPGAPPRAIDARLVTEAPSVMHANDDAWPGFLPRRPSNASEFALDETHLLRLARRVLPSPKTPEHTVVRIAALSVETRVFDGRPFERVTDAPFTIQTNGEARYLGLRFVADPGCDIVFLVDGGTPRRRAEGLAEHITVAHTIHVPAGESTALLVLGDDLEPGTHEISLLTKGIAWVHAPWVRKKKASPNGGKQAQQSTARWTEGDFGN